MFIDFLYKFVYKTVLVIFYSKKNWAKYDKNVYWSCEILFKVLLSRHIIETYCSIKSHEWEPSSMWTDGRTDVTKLRVAIRNFAKELKKETLRRRAPSTGKYSLAFWRCMHRASSYNIYINQQDAQNSCDYTLFSIRCSTCFTLY